MDISSQIQNRVELAPYTTFKIGGPAEYFISIDRAEHLETCLNWAEQRTLPVFILGGGANILISDSGFPGLVIKLDIRGVEIKKETDEAVLLAIKPSTPWDEVVEMAVKHNWWGVENLSHIPGSSGAFVVQNVGAYGQEASEVVEEVTVYDRLLKTTKILTKQECGFSYRQSIFNTTYRGRYVILETLLKLSPQGEPVLGYPDLRTRFENQQPAIQDIRQAVIAIRNRKFPFPTQAIDGNAGSCFKNLNLSVQQFEKAAIKIIELNPSAEQKLAVYRQRKNGDIIKLPTAFLIELCGLTNASLGGAAINPPQPLVILNKSGKAKATEVLGLMSLIRSKIKKVLDLDIEIEPELIGFTETELIEHGFSKKEINHYSAPISV